MENALNELSTFEDEELVKCGEIVISAKQNAFAFSCAQCKKIFSQMVVFARHVRLVHQLKGEVIGEKLQNLSVYTLEELLSDDNGTVLLRDNTGLKNDKQITKGGGRSPAKASNDTGIDSDEELEKEISDLLASIATSEYHSINGTDFSDDSGVDSKNVSDQDQYASNIEMRSNFNEELFQQHQQDVSAAGVVPIASGRNIDTVSKPNLDTIIHNEARDTSYVKMHPKNSVVNRDTTGKNTFISKISDKSRFIEKKETICQTSLTIGESTNSKELDTIRHNDEKSNFIVNLEHTTRQVLLESFKNYGTNQIKDNKKTDNHSDSTKAVSTNAKKLDNIVHSYEKRVIMAPLEDITNDILGETSSGNTSTQNKIETKDRLDPTNVGTKKMEDMELNFGMDKELDIEIGKLSELESVREAAEPNLYDTGLPDTVSFEITNNCSNFATTELEQSKNPFVFVGMDDEVTKIQFLNKGIEPMKAGIQNVLTNNLEESYGIGNLTPPDLSYEMESVVISEANKESFTTQPDVNNDEYNSHDKNKNVDPEATDVAKPLDLSLNRSTEFSETQSEENTEQLQSDEGVNKMTSDILKEVEILLTQQDASFTNNSVPSFEANYMHTFASNNRELPPFSKYFKNSANTLGMSNVVFAQSTPKQKPSKCSIHEKKHTKIASPLRPSAPLNIEVNEPAIKAECIENTNQLNQNSRKKHNKCPILKRAIPTNKDQSELKKRKVENKNIETSCEKNFVKKQGIEILSIEELPRNSTVAGILMGDGEKILNFPNIKKSINNMSKWKPSATENIVKDLSPFVKIKKLNPVKSGFSYQVAADSTTEKCMTSFNELNYTPEDTLNQLKMEQADNEKTDFYSLMRKSFRMEDSLNADYLMASLAEESISLNESILGSGSEEEKENYQLLRPLGLQIVVDPHAEDGIKLKSLETMRAKANLFAKIYSEFKYLWKVGKGLKSFEELELDFNKFMQRINEHYKLELTITETKHIVNLISLWYIQTYQNRLIKKKGTLEAVNNYLKLFNYLPKTTRRIFYCEECPRYFLSQQKYLQHRDKHLAMPSICPYCQSVYPNRKDLLLHIKGCMIFKCIECDGKFNNAPDLEYHLRNKHLWQCETCGRLCATALDVEWHEHQYPITCGLCSRIFETTAELQQHRADSFHWDYTCDMCEVFLPTATQMKHHLIFCKKLANDAF